jgi:hypothetical protein
LFLILSCHGPRTLSVIPGERGTAAHTFCHPRRARPACLREAEASLRRRQAGNDTFASIWRVALAAERNRSNKQILCRERSPHGFSDAAFAPTSAIPALAIANLAQGMISKMVPPVIAEPLRATWTKECVAAPNAIAQFVIKVRRLIHGMTCAPRQRAAADS